MTLPLLFLLIVCLTASYLGTALVRRYALARSLLDIPNDRSSHTVPTPRGGGLAVAGVLLGGVAAGWLMDVVEGRLALALCVGGSMIAAVGWLDDHRHVPARWRGLVHLSAAVIAVWLLGGLPSLRLGPTTVPLGMVGSVLAVIGIVWMVNLYNFMDGIDGIAGAEAVVVGLSGAMLSWLAGAQDIAVAATVTSMAAAGFLGWNWPPARIFMGDVGSGLLGFVFGVIALASETRNGPPLLVWGVLLGVFVVDATATLLRRIRRGERWYSAHRNHAYQRAVQAGWTHRRVTSTVIVLDLLLGAIALFAVLNPGWLPLAVGAAMILLLAAYARVERMRPM